MFVSHVQEVPAECVAGRGDQYIEHGGYTWRTLDRADPQGREFDAPNGGCQCVHGTCPANYLPLPAGWVLAPNDATSIAVVAAHGWGTGCAVLADGTAWITPAYSDGSYAGNSCSSGELATSGGTYTVTGCGAGRVLARCG